MFFYFLDVFEARLFFWDGDNNIWNLCISTTWKCSFVDVQENSKVVRSVATAAKHASYHM